MLNCIHTGLRSLLALKVRSLFALLSIGMGTAAVVAMVFCGKLATQEALKQFKSLNTNLLAITIHHNELNQTENNAKPSLTLNQALALSTLDSHILIAAPFTESYQSIIYQGKPINGTVIGATDEFKNVMHLTLKTGRFISLLDQLNPFCVIGHDLLPNAKQQQININNTLYTIIGTLTSWPQNNVIYADIDHAMIIPIQSAQFINHHADINNVVMLLSANSDPMMIEEKLTHYFQQHFPTQSISFRSSQLLIDKIRKQNDILTVFLGLIGSISLLVGGIGVMNIMLIAVHERRQEIGIRRAIGATTIDIAALFLAEAVMLSCTGGITGAILGIIAAFIVAMIQHWDFILLWWPILMSVSISIAISLFFSAYPAYKAARLDPIVALRST